MEQDFDKLRLYRKKLVRPYIKYTLSTMSVVSYLMSLLMILTVVYEYGFLVTEENRLFIAQIYKNVWRIFLLNTTVQLVLDYDAAKEKYKGLTWFVTVLLYLSLIPRIFNEPIEEDFIHTIWSLFDNALFQTILLSTLSLFQLSNGVVLLLSKKVNPSFIFSVSFIIFILIGTGLLMLPKATYGDLSFVDALFTSTSAICVTGLTTVDVATVFTPMGQTFIMLLIQVGGLGVMTLTSFFALFFMGNASLNNQIVMCDMVSSKSMNSLFQTLMFILGFTLIIEAIGAIGIFITTHGTLNMSFEEEVAFAIFHSISAFCNAGFSTLPNNLGNELLMTGHNPFYMIISFLIILGGIGFPILVNFYEMVKYRLHRLYEHINSRVEPVMRVPHLYDLNTRIVLIVTLILLGGGTLSIAVIEWNNAFAGMPIPDKLVQSFFTAVCPRTAGFCSVSMGSFSVQSILLLILLMIIGGGTQSTAGGIKVNVFAAVMLNLRAILFGTSKVIAFKRQLSDISIRSSNSTFILYFGFVFVGLFTLSIFEPDAPFLALVFECVSALSTVGASLDLTPTLTQNGKIVIVILMFIGRVGVLTMMASIIKRQKNIKCKYPSDHIIIN